MAGSIKNFINNSPPSVEADDLNGVLAENNNLILGTSQTLDTGDRQQTHRAVADYAVMGASLVDSGVADAHILSAPAPRANPSQYFDGMTVRFIPSASNTGNATVNVAGLGAQDIRRPDGTDLAVGDIVVGEATTIFYTGTEFRLLGFQPASVFQGALVFMSVDDTPSASNTILDFDGEVYDTNSFHEAVTNPSRLTIPAGVARVRLKAQVSANVPNGNYVEAAIYKNGAASYPGFSRNRHFNETGAADNLYVPVETPVLTVTPGDYFTVRVDYVPLLTTDFLGDAGATLTWFSLEVVE